MRVLIFIVLGFACATAIPQNEERSRVRGIRRFSLATPGLQAGRISENEVVSDLGEENPVVSEGSEPRTRSRGTSLLRRGHPSRRLIGRPASENQDPAAIVIDEAVEDLPSKDAGRGREGLRIRRPLKKITNIVISTTSQPVTEEVASEAITQALISTTAVSTTISSEAGTMMLKTEEGMLTEESKPIMKDEIMQKPNDKINMQDTQPTQEQGGAVVEDLNQEDSISHKSELTSQSLPRPKKLRPIPIKLGRRGQGDADQHEAPIEVITPHQDQEQEKPVGKPTSSHRFSSRTRSPLPARRRPINRQANLQIEEQPMAVEVTEALTEETPKQTRTRGRVPILSRQPSRGPARRRIGQQPESTPEEFPVLVAAIDDSATPVQEAETRFPDADELKTLLTNPVIHDEVTTTTQKSIRIQPRISKPTPSYPVQVQDIRIEVDASSPSIEAPISNAVRQGRPQRIRPDDTRHIPDLPTQLEVTNPAKSKFRIPHYGGSDLVYRAGEVQVTQIGTIEDTPTAEVRKILSGLGSKRRGLGRPRESTKSIKETPDTKATTTDADIVSTTKELQSNIDYIYDYYEQ